MSADTPAHGGSRLIVTVTITERVDPAAARALWRLLFSEPATTPAESADSSQDNRAESRQRLGRTQRSPDT